MYRKFLSLLLGISIISTAFASPAPDFAVASDKGVISLKSLRGQVIYLDFWASWCVPCRKSFPWLNDMHHKYGKAGLKVIAINLDEDKKLAKQFLKHVPAQFTIAYDPKGKSASAYGLKGMPSSYLIDRRGNIVSSHIGFRSDDAKELEARIRQALKK